MKRMTHIFIFLGLLFGMLFFPYIPMEIFHYNVDTFPEEMKVIYNLVCDLGFLIIIIFSYKDSLFKELKEYFKNIKKHFRLGIKYYLIGFLFMLISNILINYLFTGATAHNESAVRALIDKYPIYMLFSVAIYAPIVEETIFRRSIKDCFKGFKNKQFIKYFYVICSGLVFGLMHILGNATVAYGYLFIIPYMSLGIAFALLYYKTDNLWDTITFHSLHNLIAIILYLWLGV